MKTKKANNTNEYPENRLEVLLYTLQNNYSALFSSGIANMLFSIPLIILFSIRTFLVYQTETSDSLSAILQIYDINNTCNLIAILLLVLFSVSFAGTGNIIKKLSWSEDVFFLKDFKKGIKDNYLQVLITFVIIGCVNYAIGLNYIVFNTEMNTTYQILSAFCICFIFLLCPICIFLLNQIIIYKQKFLTIVKISVSIYVHSFLKSMSLFLASLLPYLLLLIPIPIAKSILLVFLIIFYSPVQMQIYFLYSSFLFDKMLNPNNFPDIINRGIHCPLMPIPNNTDTNVGLEKNNNDNDSFNK